MTFILARSLISVLTLRRIANALLIHGSYLLSRLLRRPVVWGLPLSLTIEPTSLCNLRCPECPSGARTLTRPGGFADLEAACRLIDEVAPRVAGIQFYFQGEPFLHRDLPALIAHARKRNMFVGISTNAHFMTRELADTLVQVGLQRLVVSLDGVTEESYTAYRVGGSLATVLESLEHLRAARASARHCRTDVILQFLVNKFNEGEIETARALASRYDARLVLKTMQVYSVESAKRFLPSDPAFSRYHPDSTTLRTLAAPANTCSQLWMRSVVTWDGTLVPCCFDKDAEFAFANVFEVGFAEGWRSSAFRAFRNRILHERGAVPMCGNCTEGLSIYR